MEIHAGYIMIKNSTSDKNVHINVLQFIKFKHATIWERIAIVKCQICLQYPFFKLNLKEKNNE